MRIKLIVLLLFSLCLPLNLAAEPAEKKDPQLHVIATFSVLSDLVSQIGGESVNVQALVGWEQDAHVYRASPQDAKRLHQANMLVENGLGFEGWVSRLIQSANFKGLRVVASDRVNVILSQDRHDGHDHDGDADPHAWLGTKEAAIYIENILQGLKKLRPEKSDYFDQNASILLRHLQDMRDQFASRLSHLPVKSRNIVVPHNAFAYLGREFGLRIHSLQGLSTESEASAAQVAGIIKQIKKLDIRAVFAENVSDDRLIRVVQQETRAKFGGELLSGALSHERAPNYLSMMQYNFDLIAKALQ